MPLLTIILITSVLFIGDSTSTTENIGSLADKIIEKNMDKIKEASSSASEQKGESFNCGDDIYGTASGNSASGGSGSFVKNSIRGPCPSGADATKLNRNEFFLKFIVVCTTISILLLNKVI